MKYDGVTITTQPLKHLRKLHHPDLFHNSLTVHWSLSGGNPYKQALIQDVLLTVVNHCIRVGPCNEIVRYNIVYQCLNNKNVKLSL
jgi:hypothetical protein